VSGRRLPKQHGGISIQEESHRTPVRHELGLPCRDPLVVNSPGPPPQSWIVDDAEISWREGKGVLLHPGLSAGTDVSFKSVAHELVNDNAADSRRQNGAQISRQL
jgi:hypothetical protein